MENTENTTPPDKSPIRILLVDDREDNLFSMESILEEDGYTIVKANSGRAALKALMRQEDFTLILMDVQMPDMDGFETANLIYERERLKAIPIIFITAHDFESEYIFKSHQLGGVDYITKPVNPGLLRVKVNVFVELYRKTRQLMDQEQKLLAINKSLEQEIEDHKKTEEKIRLLNKQLIENNVRLESANEELNRFAYVASHDLQEPLRKIKIFSTTLLAKCKDRIDEEMNLYIQKIIQSSERMQLLISDLLRFSRQLSNESDFRLVDMNLLLTSLIADMEISIADKGAVIHLDELPAIVAIPGQIYQLFQNLLSNSLKYSKEDTAPHIHIYSEEPIGKGENNTYAVICIRDNGIGFDPKYAEEIFAVFKRLHHSHEFEGTGVGLAICKKIVEGHKGFIRAESKIGEGTVLTIGLPLKYKTDVVAADHNAL